MENLQVSCVKLHALSGSKDSQAHVCFPQYRCDVSESSPDAVVARAQHGHAGIALAQNIRAPSADDIICGGDLLRPYCKCLDKCLD